jgi:tRNA pseudouridine32 synthase/23S rRNA pseudouridine746 synthase
MQKQHYSYKITDPVTQNLADFLATQTGISKTRIKAAMLNGAVWLRQNKAGLRRVRRATTTLHRGDQIEFYYDAALQHKHHPVATQLWSCKEYSLWYKPAGLLAQGTHYGDHACVLRQAELAMPAVKQTFLVHRLDREASGLMLIAHSSAAAHQLSELFKAQRIQKRYNVVVKGRVEPAQGKIDLPLDGKSALTEYTLQDFDAATQTSTLNVEIKTGRTHQIRRHLAAIGFPVMGDPEYGQQNKNTEGLQLTAAYLGFVCPLSGQQRNFDLAVLLTTT